MNTICPFPSLRCLLFASLMIMVMALASCVAEEPEAADDGSSVVRMDLRLSVSEFPTRAASQDVNAMENTINRSDLLIAAYDGAGRLIETICKDGHGFEGDGSKLEFSHEILERKYAGRGEVMIVAVANRNAFGGDGNGAFETPATLTELRNSLQFVLPSGGNIPECLPMYGIQRISPEQFVGNQPLELNIKMRRAVAKIEIVNATDDGSVITSAVMLHYNSCAQLLPNEDSEGDGDAVTKPSIPEAAAAAERLTFYKSTDSKTHYAYVPEMTFGEEAKADNRCIELMVKKGEAETTTRLWLSPYGEDGMPRQATTEEPQWQSLLRNHLYRFKITAFTGSGAAPDITQTILVRWYYTVSKCYGKFNFELYDNLKVKKSSGWETFTTSTLGNHNRWPTRTFEILLDKIPSSKNIPYVFSSSSKGIQCTEGNLFEDAVFYGIDEETGNTIFILNNPIVSGGSTKMPVDKRYRFYCRNSDYCSVSLDGNNLVSKKYDLIYDNDKNNGYKYAEFEMPQQNNMVRFYVLDSNGSEINSIINGDLYYVSDIFIENIGGTEYYVFYLD